MINVEFNGKMKEAGLNITPQRQAVYEALSLTTIHPNVEYIYTKVKRRLPMISLATIYKTLEIFVENGLILEIGSLDDLRRFDGNSIPHPHLVCIGCNTIKDIENIETDWAKEIKEYLTNVMDYNIIKNLVTFYGYCPDCKKKQTYFEGTVS